MLLFLESGGGCSHSSWPVGTRDTTGCRAADHGVYSVNVLVEWRTVKI